MADLMYYLRANSGKPLRDELFSISPWFVAEGIAQNAIQATRDYFKKGQFPDQIKVDRFVSTVKRKMCSRTNIHVYEVFFDNMIASVTFLSIGCYNDDFVALAIGNRDRRSAIHHISNYPYLDQSLTRLETEFGLSGQNFEWILKQAN
jgi:hypothetical protein